MRAFAKAWLAVPLFWHCLSGNAVSAQPQFSKQDLVSAADHTSGKVTPGEIVVVFASNAGPDTLAGAAASPQGRIPTTLGQTRVLFDGVPAPVAFSTKGQVGVVVPYEIANRKKTQVLVEYEGQRSLPVTLPVAVAAPAIFTLDLSGKGQAAILNETGCCNSSRNPAMRGSVVTLYATGEGQTYPRGITGKVSIYRRTVDYPVPQLPVKVTVGGVPAELTYAGEAPHAVAGLLQVNFRVPARAPLGDAVPIVLMVGESSSIDGITMAVRSAVQRVLVVEPDPYARVRIRRMLAGAGYAAFEAQSAAGGLQLAKERSVDLVIWSLTNPEQNGSQTIQELNVQQPPIKIVALARALDPETLRAADLLGAQALLTYGMRRESLLRRVREALRVTPVAYATLQEQLSKSWNSPIQR